MLNAQSMLAIFIIYLFGPQGSHALKKKKKKDLT